MKVSIKNLKNEDVGNISLLESVFGLPERPHLLHQMVLWQLAKRQAGTHKTKTISEISGTTAKPWRQKGTGRARQGSLRSPQFRGGATIFGPVVRSHAFNLNKKVRKLALKTALSLKASEGKLVILKDTVVSSPKTTSLQDSLAKLGFSSALIVDGSQVNDNFLKAVRNLKHIDAMPQIGLNVYDILQHDQLVLTEEAVKLLMERLA